ncbi:MAG: ADP-ribosyltransferase, partial [Oscillospiraceae bacterium]
NPMQTARQFSMSEAKLVNEAVQTKLDGWKTLTAQKRIEKLNYEINWIGKNQKYSTWKVAQDAYKKELVQFETAIKWENIDGKITLLKEFKTKSKVYKSLVADIEIAKVKGISMAEIEKMIQQAESRKNDIIKYRAPKFALSDEEIQQLLTEFNSVSINEIDTYMRPHTEEWWKGLSLAERNVVTKHTQTYHYLNEPLRVLPYYGSLTPSAEHIKDLPILEKALSKSKMSKDMVVRRGLDNYQIKELGYNLKDIKTGDVFVDKGFLSSSLEKSTGFHREYELIIIVPKGSQGIFAEPFSHYTDNAKFNYNNNHKNATLWDGKSKETIHSEFEWIGQRGSQFEVIKRAGKTIYVKLIGQLK